MFVLIINRLCNIKQTTFVDISGRIPCSLLLKLHVTAVNVSRHRGGVNIYLSFAGKTHYKDILMKTSN